MAFSILLEAETSLDSLLLGRPLSGEGGSAATLEDTEEIFASIGGGGGGGVAFDVARIFDGGGEGDESSQPGVKAVKRLLAKDLYSSFHITSRKKTHVKIEKPYIVPVVYFSVLA